MATYKEKAIHLAVLSIGVAAVFIAPNTFVCLVGMSTRKYLALNVDQR
jgi:hypothetical protein